jgi:hypothetical protein
MSVGLAGSVEGTSEGVDFARPLKLGGVGGSRAGAKGRRSASICEEKSECRGKRERESEKRTERKADMFKVMHESVRIALVLETSESRGGHVDTSRVP